jgi:hypothetical protein
MILRKIIKSRLGYAKMGKDNVFITDWECTLECGHVVELEIKGHQIRPKQINCEECK